MSEQEHLDPRSWYRKTMAGDLARVYRGALWELFAKADGAGDKETAIQISQARAIFRDAINRLDEMNEAVS